MEVHMSRLARLSIILSALAVASACTDRAPGPTGLGITASRNGAPFSAGLASPAWQAMAFAQVPRPPALNALSAARAYALLGVAQYLGVQRADMAVGDGDNDGGRTQLEAERGAVAGASAVVLTYLFPGAAQAFEDLVTTQASAVPVSPTLGLDVARRSAARSAPLSSHGDKAMDLTRSRSQRRRPGPGIGPD